MNEIVVLGVYGGREEGVLVAESGGNSCDAHKESFTARESACVALVAAVPNTLLVRLAPPPACHFTPTCFRTSHVSSWSVSPVPQVLEGVTPQVQFVKVVNDELVELMGSEGSKDLEAGAPQIILMAGLQVWVVAHQTLQHSQAQCRGDGGVGGWVVVTHVVVLCAVCCRCCRCCRQAIGRRRTGLGLPRAD